MARWSSLAPLLFLATSCLATGGLALQAGEGGIQNFLTVIADEDGDAASSVATAKQPVSVLWGLHDASAMLGKLFKYALPKEAFQGDISQYKVSKKSPQEMLAPQLSIKCNFFIIDIAR